MPQKKACCSPAGDNDFVQGGGEDPFLHFVIICSREKPMGSKRTRKVSPSPLPASPAEQ